MADLGALENRVREERTRRGWSQDELGRRSGLSRAGVSAIENGRLVPSAAAALALAGAFGCRVEDVFSLPGTRSAGRGAAWAWEPSRWPSRFWSAEVGGRARLYPVESGPLGVVPHDGVAHELGRVEAIQVCAAGPTLVMACCDPAVGLLADELGRAAGVRVIALSRSSRAALDLLARGLVHVAGVHLASAEEHDGNAARVRTFAGLESAYLLRAARWQEGVALASSQAIRSVRDALQPRVRWVGREVGSGARQCLDELLGDRRPPRRLAHDHRSVAEAVRAGWADAGVCLRLTCEEAGLAFLEVREEPYDLCFPDALIDDPRIQSLIAVVRSTTYRRLVSELPGYDSRETGELRPVG